MKSTGIGNLALFETCKRSAESIQSIAGADHLYGGTGADTLLGDQGGSTLMSEASNDALYGRNVRALFVQKTSALHKTI
jgi:Ca2+-binding RTX toxin-like protein